MLLDAVSAIRCCTKTQKQIQEGNKIDIGADYESEDDKPGKRLKKKVKDINEFGAEENEPINRSQSQHSIRSKIFDARSNYSYQTAAIDEETRRQIMMLEELARQMRDEKEQLRLEKERIEREREAMYSDAQTYKDSGLGRQTNLLSRTLGGEDDSENTQRRLLNEGSSKALLEQQRLQQKRNFFDVEGEEMADYDAIDEE